MLACLVFVLGLKMLTLVHASEALFLQPDYSKADSSLSLAADKGHEKQLSHTAVKNSAQQSLIFEDEKAFDLKLKSDFRDELHKLFSSFAKYDLSSRILAFHKSYAALLSVSEHHSPLYVLDHALII